MKKLSKVFLAMMMIVSLSACGKQTDTTVIGSTENGVTAQSSEDLSTKEANTAYPVTIMNYNYSKESIPVTFEKAPEKVFCLYQNSIEIMLALGLEDRIVAAAGLDHPVKPEYAAAFDKINYLSDFELTKETVIMLEPDLILTWMSPFNEKKLGDVDFWHARGTNTYMAPNSNSLEENRTLENEYRYILEIGQIFNVEERAQALVDEIKSEVERVRTQTADQAAERVMIMEFMDDSIYVYGKNTLGGDMVTTLGGEVVEGEGSSIGVEDLIHLNPDVLYVVYMDQTGQDEGTEEVNKVLNNPALASLKAVQNGRVYAMPLGEMYASAVRTIDGVTRFAEGMYPEE